MNRSGILKEHSLVISLIQKLMDIASLIGVLFISATMYGIDWDNPLYLLLAFCAISLFLFFANVFELYRSWRRQSIWDELKRVLLTLLAMGTGLLLLGYITKISASYSRLALGTWVLVLPLVMLLARMLLRNIVHHIRKQSGKTRRVAIIGTGALAQQVALEIQTSPWMGMDVLGYYDDRQQFRGKIKNSPDIPIIGNFADAMQQGKAGVFDELYIALPMQAAEKINILINELSDCSIPVHLVQDVFTFNLMNSRTAQIGQIPIISIYESPLDEMGVVTKRVEDYLLASLILSVISIPMLLIAIGIKLTSPGPVIFKQRRYGLKGGQIEVWKFRSMTVTEDGDNVKQATKGDSRITPFGAFLRKTSLDELPQFINVLQGRMSIVGPRPHAVAHNEMYRKNIDGYMLRHLVKPGITGWAQINGWRGETDTDEKMQKRIQYDLEYLRKWSIWLDIKIVFMTIFKGFANKNAY